MKFLAVKISNFRLLGDITLKFSTDDVRNVTVIRAANDSGKTTLATALQWCLYGNPVLPDRGEGFRFSPLDASSGKKTLVSVKVQLDYQIATRVGLRKFRLIREVTETVRGKMWDRLKAPQVQLVEFTNKGVESVPNARSVILAHLPRKIHRVFFTDGDSALNFIQGARWKQKQRVKEATRFLLGIQDIENALKHMKKVKAILHEKISATSGYDQQLSKVAQELAEIEHRLPQDMEELEGIFDQQAQLKGQIQETDRMLKNALIHGNREDMVRKRKSLKRKRKAAEADVRTAIEDHSHLLSGDTVARALLAVPFAKAGAILRRLRSDGVIPKQTVPVLEERLQLGVCICGESLDKSEERGRQHRVCVQQLIEDCRGSDAVQRKMTDLYFDSRELLKPLDRHSWREEYRVVFARRQEALERKDRLGGKEAELKRQIETLPDIDVTNLQSSLDRYREDLDELTFEEGQLANRIESDRERNTELEKKEKKLMAKKDRHGALLARLHIIQDTTEVLQSTQETLKTREVERVSRLMSSLFLEMIGSDQSQESIITGAFITPEFQIQVLGRHDTALDPSRDLNGASRRALTIAFILAVTEVCSVTAPNVIDTPLGMLSGYVKQSVVKVASERSSQLILLLTHSEITDCEEILDSYSGRAYTFTNPAHFPKILVNDPGGQFAGVVTCKCTHREECSICSRREIVVSPQ